MPDEGWILNLEERTLTRALLVYRYSDIASSGVPIEWHQLLSSGEWQAVMDDGLLSSLNNGLKYRLAVLESSDRPLRRRKGPKARGRPRSR